MFGISSDMLIIIGSALGAALSFAAFVLPLLNRSQKKERFKSIIEKRRQDLYQQTKDSLDKKGQKALSARESVATFFKIQKMFGEMGEGIREQLLQAGIRDPKAPIKFILAQIMLPLVLTGFAMLVLSKGDKEVSSVVQMLVLGCTMVSGYYLPKIIIKNQAMKRIEELNFTFPDALDIMLICVQGGIGLEQTVERVAHEIAEQSPVLAEELGILSAEMAMLSDRRAALGDFGKRVGGYGKSFATALIQAEQYGTSVSQALRVMADELRDVRMSNAEQKAASLPPKLTVPMILFFLPALFIVILGPAGISASAAGVGG